MPIEKTEEIIRVPKDFGKQEIGYMGEFFGEFFKIMTRVIKISTEKIFEMWGGKGLR